MSTLHKKIGNMISQPNDIDFKTLDFVLKEIGCTVRNNGSSHYYYKHPEKSISVTIPKASPIKRCYVIQIFKLFGLKELYDENK